MEINPEDIRIDTYTPAVNASHPGYIVHMRLTHLPTGHTVEGSSKSRHRLKQQLMEELCQQTQ